MNKLQKEYYLWIVPQTSRLKHDIDLIQSNVDISNCIGPRQFVISVVRHSRSCYNDAFPCQGTSALSLHTIVYTQASSVFTQHGYANCLVYIWVMFNLF